MYVKRHGVRRGGKRYVYLRLVEAYRDERDKVRHRVLATLGREDELKASGQLDQLAASFARLDPPPVGTRRQVGALLLVRALPAPAGAGQAGRAAVPMRGRAQLTHGEVVAALVANRLSAPSPLYDVAGWASSAALAELFDIPAMLLNDDRLGRALEALRPGRRDRCAASWRWPRPHGGAGPVPAASGPDRCPLRRRLRALGAGRQGLGRRPQHRPAGPHPAGIHPRRGPGLLPATQRRRQRAALLRRGDGTARALAPPGLVVVADSGLGYLGHLCAADRAGLRFVVPLRADTGWAERFLHDVGDLDPRPPRPLLATPTAPARQQRTR